MSTSGTDITHLTYATAAAVATHRAVIDIGENKWDELTLAEQNNHTAHYLKRLWEILDNAHTLRKQREREARDAA